MSQHPRRPSHHLAPTSLPLLPHSPSSSASSPSSIPECESAISSGTADQSTYLLLARLYAAQNDTRSFDVLKMCGERFPPSPASNAVPPIARSVAVEIAGPTSVTEVRRPTKLSLSISNASSSSQQGGISPSSASARTAPGNHIRSNSKSPRGAGGGKKQQSMTAVHNPLLVPLAISQSARGPAPVTSTTILPPSPRSARKAGQTRNQSKQFYLQPTNDSPLPAPIIPPAFYAPAPAASSSSTNQISARNGAASARPQPSIQQVLQPTVQPLQQQHHHHHHQHSSSSHPHSNKRGEIHLPSLMQVLTKHHSRGVMSMQLDEVLKEVETVNEGKSVDANGYDETATAIGDPAQAPQPSPAVFVETSHALTPRESDPIKHEVPAKSTTPALPNSTSLPTASPSTQPAPPDTITASQAAPPSPHIVAKSATVSPATERRRLAASSSSATESSKHSPKLVSSKLDQQQQQSVATPPTLSRKASHAKQPSSSQLIAPSSSAIGHSKRPSASSTPQTHSRQLSVTKTTPKQIARQLSKSVIEVPKTEVETFTPLTVPPAGEAKSDEVVQKLTTTTIVDAAISTTSEQPQPATISLPSDTSSSTSASPSSIPFEVINSNAVDSNSIVKLEPMPAESSLSPTIIDNPPEHEHEHARELNKRRASMEAFIAAAEAEEEIENRRKSGKTGSKRKSLVIGGKVNSERKSVDLSKRKSGVLAKKQPSPAASPRASKQQTPAAAVASPLASPKSSARNLGMTASPPHQRKLSVVGGNHERKLSVVANAGAHERKLSVSSSTSMQAPPSPRVKLNARRRSLVKSDASEKLTVLAVATNATGEEETKSAAPKPTESPRFAAAAGRRLTATKAVTTKRSSTKMNGSNAALVAAEKMKADATTAASTEKPATQLKKPVVSLFGTLTKKAAAIFSTSNPGTPPAEIGALPTKTKSTSSKATTSTTTSAVSPTAKKIGAAKAAAAIVNKVEPLASEKDDGKSSQPANDQAAASTSKPEAASIVNAVSPKAKQAEKDKPAEESKMQPQLPHADDKRAKSRHKKIALELQNETHPSLDKVSSSASSAGTRSDPPSSSSTPLPSLHGGSARNVFLTYKSSHLCELTQDEMSEVFTFYAKLDSHNHTSEKKHHHRSGSHHKNAVTHGAEATGEYDTITEKSSAMRLLSTHICDAIMNLYRDALEARQKDLKLNDKQIDDLVKKEREFMLPGGSIDPVVNAKHMKSALMDAMDFTKTHKLTRTAFLRQWNGFASKWCKVREDANALECSIM